MTREDHIEILKQYKEKQTLINEISSVEEAVWLDEALDAAIQALEQEPDAIHNEREQEYMKGYGDASKRYRTEPCEDAISRQDAIRVASGYCHWSNIPEELAKLPSVNPIPCEDAISRQAAIVALDDRMSSLENVDMQIAMGFAKGIIHELPSVTSELKWIPVSERLPETDNENSINNYNVLLWVKNKTHPEYEPQIYLGKLKHVGGDDGSGNFWGLETKPCDWTIWGWYYFNEPEVIAWMPLPQPYEPKESEDKE